jgi:adenosylmethionine-8-amino-7-oxononanoate aminotransferase
MTAHAVCGTQARISRRGFQRAASRRTERRFQVSCCLLSIIRRIRSASRTWRIREDSQHEVLILPMIWGRLVTLHDASTIAAVIVEPVAGSIGVLIPPQGYLQRLREICDRHGMLMIFDEVITGWGRLGVKFAAQYFDVTPDMAKGTDNAAAPMEAVAASVTIRGLDRE